MYAACEELERRGVAFQKKPDEGRMKGLAFAKDPDGEVLGGRSGAACVWKGWWLCTGRRLVRSGRVCACLSFGPFLDRSPPPPTGYWIEIVSRDASAAAFRDPEAPRFSLAQTMLRVKDPRQSLRFYRDLLGMRLLAIKHFSDFSLYFLAQPASLPPSLLASLPASVDPSDESGRAVMKQLPGPVLELTHNHGTEKEEGFSYHNGNTDPRGFGHVGFLCDDLEGACAMLEGEGVAFQKKPSEGSMRGLAFAKDPDGYWVELVGRGLAI